MSFKCSQCTEAQPNRVKPNRIVVATRNVTYKLRDGRVSTGTEIVKEIDLCNACV